MASHILIAKGTINAFHIGIDGLRDLTLVEGGPTFPGNQTIGVRKVGVLENLTNLHRSVFEVSRSCVVELADHFKPPLKGGKIALKVIGNDRRDREAVFGIGNGGCQNLPHPKLAEPVVELKPSVDRARHADGEGPKSRDRIGVADLRLQIL